jgi:hypothetical protein
MDLFFKYFWVFKASLAFKYKTKKKKKNPWLAVRKRTIPIKRPPLVSEASANFCG